MFSYEGGLFIAFLIWVYSFVMGVVSINSQFEKNLNKVGLRLSWLTLAPKQMTASDVNRPFYLSVLKYLLIYSFSLAMIFLSWVSVLMSLGMIVYQKSKDFGAPNEVREFRWKLRNLDMSFDAIVEGMARMNGESLENIEEAKNILRESMKAEGLPLGR